MSSKKQTDTSSTSNTNSTTTPNVPDWIAQPAQSMAGNINGLLAQGPAPFTPGTSALQQQANTNAGALTTSPYYGQAADAVGNVGNISADQVTGQSVLDNLSSYYNPFKDQVLNPVLNDYDQQAGMTQAAQAAAAAKNQAFQGSRYGLQAAQTTSDLARGRASTEGTLLNQMYGSATGLSAQDAANRQQAMLANQSADLSAATANQNAMLQKGQLLAGLGTNQDADARGNVALQGELGQAQTGMDNAQKQYPLTYDAQTEALLQGLNPGLFTGQTQVGTGKTTGTTTTSEDPGALGVLGTAAQIGGLFAAPFTGGLSLAAMSAAAPGSAGFGNIVSDRRLKRDVTRIGVRADGIPLYAFRYLWDRIVRYGVMAQDVLRVKPEAVIRHAAGFLMVDYGALA